jgi:hypothetical protein
LEAEYVLFFHRLVGLVIVIPTFEVPHASVEEQVDSH